jgi:hypothetical protein
MARNPNEGLIYVLHSPRCKSIKIGRTNVSLVERIRGINASPNYGPLGLWTVAGCLRVFNTESIERRLHKLFAQKRSHLDNGVNELFEVSVLEALDELAKIEPELRAGHPQATKLFRDHLFRDYLLKLFHLTGLFGALDQQGAWTLSLYPSTAGGRYFTLNIGTHEVAFSTLPRKRSTEEQLSFVVVDRLLLDFQDTISWLENNGGQILETTYETDRGRSVMVEVPGPFTKMMMFLELDGVRKALIAYWVDWLVEMREHQTKSLFARFHNYEAVFLLADYRRLKEQ